MNIQKKITGQTRKTIYLSGVSGNQQIRERIYMYNTLPKTIQIARTMLQRLDGGVAFVRNDDNGKYTQVGGTNKDNRRDIVDMIEQKYSKRAELRSPIGGSNIPAGYNDDGGYVGY